MTIRHPRQPLVGLFLFAALGISAGDYWPVDPLLPLILLGVLGALLVFHRSNAGTFVFVAFAFFLLHNLQIQNNPGLPLTSECAEAPLQVKAIGMVVTEPEEKQSMRNIPSCRFRLRLESIETNGLRRPQNAVVLSRWLGPAPEYGDRISITGELGNIAPPRNPGQFDYRNYLRRAGIYSEIQMKFPNDGEVLDSGHGNPAIASGIAARRWMQEKLVLDLENSPAAAGLIQSIVLGQKGETPDAVRELFQRTGTLHLFVVNGLHIGMFTYILMLWVRMLGAGRRLSVIIIVPLIFFYALLTGFNPGSIRASVMAAIMLSGQLVDRKPLILNNLAAAGFGLLLWNTNEIFVTGFQFSMGVVLAIVLLAGSFEAFLLKFGTPDSFLPRNLWTSLQETTYRCWRQVSKLLGASTAACIGSLPFTAGYFHLVTPLATAANLVVVPAAFLILAEGILSVIAACFSNMLAAIFNNMNLPFAHFILWAVSLFAQIPGSHFYLAVPALKRPPPCELTVFDLSAGGAIELHSGGQRWLIDCGNVSSYESIVRPCLRSRGVNRLDTLILAHGNIGFIGAVGSLLPDFAPKKVMMPSLLVDRSQTFRNLRPLLATQFIENQNCKRGDLLEFTHQGRIRVLYPPPDIVTRSINDKALVLKIECNGTSALLSTSTGSQTSRWLLENEPDLRSDVLIVNQSGSEGQDTIDFLNAVAPKVIICGSHRFPVSAGMDEAWAQEVKRRGIRLFRQDQTGAVSVGLGSSAARTGFFVTSFLNGEIFFGENGNAK